MCHKEVEKMKGEMVLYRQCSGGESNSGQGESGSAGMGGMSSGICSQCTPLASHPTGVSVLAMLSSPPSWTWHW